MRRVYSASDVRRYARCPRQWWYEARQDELAQLTLPEVERRMAALRRRHGASAQGLPAYQLLADLAARDERLREGRDVHHAHARRALRGPTGCLSVVAGLLTVLVLLPARVKRYM